MTIKAFFIATAVLGFLGVALGAFGAHGLKEILADYGEEIWQKAVFYQMVHVLAILFVIILKFIKPELNVTPVLWGFFVGILLFSGSLYILALTNIKILGAITPIGGVAFLFAWIWLAIIAVKNVTY